MPDFREVPESEVYDFRRLVGYAFMPEEEPPDPEDDEITPPMEVGTRYGRYDGEDLIAVCKLLDMQTSLRGDSHPMAGVSFVASPPETRRQGHVKELLADALVQCREDGAYLSALHPFKRTYYDRFGWATATRYLRHSMDPELLSFARDDRDGEFVQLETEDWERMDDVYRTEVASHELTLDRDEEWWTKRVLAGWRTDPYVYGFERDGDLAAYVVYSVEENGDGRTFKVHDWAAVDHDARLAVLRFCSDHDSQVEDVAFNTAPDDDLLDVVPNADDVETDLEVSTMLRLVDVPEALEALSYPEDVSGELTLDVADSMAPWNDEMFRVTVEDGAATVEPTAEPADAELDVGALSQLYAGYRGARELATVGELAADEATVDHLAELFPTTTTYLREGF
jgi:predicted acetyltransferase